MKLCSVLFTTLAAGLLLPTLTHAQEPSLAGRSWASANDLQPGERIEIVTTANPTRLTRCHIASIAEDSIGCSRHFGHKPQLFDRQDIVALVRPGRRHSFAIGLTEVGGISAGIVVGAVFLAPISLYAAVPVAIVGGIAFCFGWVAVGFNELDRPERLLYLAPGAQLQVALK